LLAAQNAIANPLLDETSLKGAKAVLVNITGGLDMTLLEVDEAANAISAEVDGDANIIFGAAFDPALDGKIRVSVVATGMDESGVQRAEPSAPAAPSQTAPLADHGARRSAGGLYGTQASRAPEPAREPYREPVRAERAPEPRPEPRIEAAPVVPSFQSPPAPEPRPEPVIRVAEPTPRALDPIVDPWVEEYETTRAPATQSSRAPEPQGDLYAARSPEPAVDDYDDRDHRRSGWSLFGRGKRAQPQPEPTYSPRPTSQMRSAAQPQAQAEPETGHADDDLEIPSFLRRLAN
ncbi:MAG: cell division protein FtsZ, partial [Brevundimonas sp. 32-68-21]